MTIEQVDPERTVALRQQVLRPNLRLDQMNIFGDDGPGAATFGASDSDTGEVVSTAMVRREAPRAELVEVVPAEAIAGAWRLRGMATRQDLRSTGIGSRVLAACLRYVAAQGGGLLWCNARVPALRFYESGGFRAWDDTFVSEGVEHIVMWRLVEPAAPTEG